MSLAAAGMGAYLFVALASCSGESGEAPRPEVCPPYDLRVGYNLQTPRVLELDVVADDGTALVGNVVPGMNLYLRKDGLPYDVPFALIVSNFFSRTPTSLEQSALRLRTTVVTSVEMLEAEAGARLVHVGAGEFHIFSPDDHVVPSCEMALPNVETVVTVVAAKGDVDTTHLIIDRNFERTFDVELDLKAPGCGIASLRAHLRFEANNQMLAFNCRDAATFVGDAGSE